MLNELSQTKKDKCYMISLKWRIKKVEFKEAERMEVIEGGQGLRGLGQECVLSSGPALLGGYGSGLRTAGARQRARVRVGTRGGA